MLEIETFDGLLIKTQRYH